MAAYVVNEIWVNDPETFQTYVAFRWRSRFNNLHPAWVIVS